MINEFKFLTANRDVPTPQEIRNSPWLTEVYRQGSNAGMTGHFDIPTEYYASKRTMNAWFMGYNDADVAVRPD